MRNFAMIPPSIWTWPAVVELDGDAQRLYFYILTSPHQNFAGCCRLPAAYAQNDLRCSDADYLGPFERLITRGLIHADEETDEVFVDKWFDLYGRPANLKHRKGITRLLDAVRSGRLREIALGQLKECDPPPSVGHPLLNTQFMRCGR